MSKLKKAEEKIREEGETLKFRLSVAHIQQNQMLISYLTPFLS